MQYSDIILNIRRIVNREKYDPMVIEILKKKHCRSLLNLTEYSSSNAFQLSLKLNELAIDERINALKSLLFDLESYSYAMIKGFVLSYQIYNDVRIRNSGDVDLLIHRSDIDDIKQIMIKHGYIQGTIKDGVIVPYTRAASVFQVTQSHQMAPFIKPIDSKICPFIQVDINFDVFKQQYQLKNRSYYMLENTEGVILNSVLIKKLLPEVEFIALCLHHYKDLNSVYLLYGRGINITYFCDLYFYIINNNLDLTKMYEHAVALQALPYIYYCVFYANEIFNDDRLLEIMYIMQTEEGKRLINQYGFNHVYQWDVDFYTRLFSETFRDDFYKKLTNDDKRRIEINDKYM